MKQNIFGVWLIYFGFIASSFSAIFSIFFFVIGLVSIFISLINTSKLSSLFLIITLIALYKLISYFLLVDKNFTLSIDYINNEGRFIFALVLLIAFTLIRLDKDSIYKVSFGCRNIFLLWLPILFFDSFGNTIEAFCEGCEYVLNLQSNCHVSKFPSLIHLELL